MHGCAGVFIFCCQNLNLPRNERMPTNQMRTLHVHAYANTTCACTVNTTCALHVHYMCTTCARVRVAAMAQTPVLDDRARGRNSLEQGGAGICTIATSSSNYMKEFFYLEMTKHICFKVKARK